MDQEYAEWILYLILVLIKINKTKKNECVLSFVMFYTHHNVKLNVTAEKISA